MKIPFSPNLYSLAKSLDQPLYVVGGAVRNYLIDQSLAKDVDLASPVDVDEMVRFAQKSGFKVSGVYPRTGTVKFSDGESEFEFTSFRKEKYHGGEHLPYCVERTCDIVEDAKRRDFKCNAVYYDLLKQEIVDPLGGVEDIKNKVLDTVVSAEKVFRHDGLRIMRLARFVGQLGFCPTDKVIEEAKNNVENLKEVSVERIYTELKKILVSDSEYPFSDKLGHYNGLKVLDRVGALDIIVPELTLGRNMVQRADFHNYDVLEHSLRTVMYAPKEIRLDALLHDVGKPYCLINTGKYYDHDRKGVEIAERILNRLKVDNATVRRVKTLVRYHMVDIDGKMGKNKVKRLIIQLYGLLDDLFALKQADASACKDSLDQPGSITKWKDILAEMKGDGTPFSIKELKICAKDLIELGYKGKEIGEELESLLTRAVQDPKINDTKKLLSMAIKDVKSKSPTD